MPFLIKKETARRRSLFKCCQNRSGGDVGILEVPVTIGGVPVTGDLVAAQIKVIVISDGDAGGVRHQQILCLMQIAEAGGTMPPKSTWFEPKLGSGLFMHRLK